MERGLSRCVASLAFVCKKDLLRQAVDGVSHQTEEEHSMELLLAIGVIYVIGYLIYRNGKREGSKKGYGVGLHRGRRGRGRRR